MCEESQRWKMHSVETIVDPLTCVFHAHGAIREDGDDVQVMMMMMRFHFPICASDGSSFDGPKRVYYGVEAPSSWKPPPALLYKLSINQPTNQPTNQPCLTNNPPQCLVFDRFRNRRVNLQKPSFFQTRKQTNKQTLRFATPTKNPSLWGKNDATSLFT